MSDEIDPDNILTAEGYEVPRTLDELSVWWWSKYQLFAATKAGRAYAREGNGLLIKKFHDEAQPMIAYMRRFPPKAGVRCKLLAGNEEEDALYVDSSGSVARKFQITTAVDGRTEKLRRRQLTRVGHVDGLAKLTDDDEIPDDALPSDRYSLIEEMAAYVLAAIERKNEKGYDPGFTLIVGFNDNTFDGEEDLSRFRMHIGNPTHKFAELYIVGILGHIAIP